MTEAEYGTTEAAYRRWIGSLGPLSDRQAAEAEHVYVLAAQLDLARAEGVRGAAAAISRELRQLAAGIRETPTAMPAGEPTPAPAAGVQDDVARKRAERARERRKGSA